MSYGTTCINVAGKLSAIYNDNDSLVDQRMNSSAVGRRHPAASG